MADFFFFKHGGICETMTDFLKNKIYKKYLTEPIEFNGRNTRFYLILDWIHRDNHGANIDFIKQYNMNYVQSLDDLPEGCGAYAVGYDVDLKDLQKIKEQNIPYIENSCPRIKLLRNQLLSVDAKKYQAVFMIYDYHLIYSCYKSAFPEDIIVVNPENYKEQLSKYRNDKPVHLLVYGVFRPKEVAGVISYINENYQNKNNILDSYDKTRCCWTKQGLLEELEKGIIENKLDEIWVICSNEEDTSTRGILKEIADNGARSTIIKSEKDIPLKTDPESHYGVVIAPIPISDEIRNCVNIINAKHT